MIYEIRALLSAETAAEVARELGGAPFTDGRSTAQGEARAAKNNLQLDQAHPTARRLGAVVLGALGNHEVVRAAILPRTVLPILFARYVEGMAYGEHFDLPIVGAGGGPVRTDLSMTVWLSPRDAYDGGELVIETDGGSRSLKGGAGDAVIYPSTTLHRVTPVTRGERVVAVTWIQSLIRSAEHRQILLSLVQIASALQARGDAEEELSRLRQTQYQLTRLWAEC